MQTVVLRCVNGVMAVVQRSWYERISTVVRVYFDRGTSVFRSVYRCENCPFGLPEDRFHSVRTVLAPHDTAFYAKRPRHCRRRKTLITVNQIYLHHLQTTSSTVLKSVSEKAGTEVETSRVPSMLTLWNVTPLIVFTGVPSVPGHP